MDPPSPSRRRKPLRGQRGDVSILFVLLLLGIIVLGSVVVSGLVIANLRGTRDIVASTQAFYAADTANELGRMHAEWQVDYPSPDDDSGAPTDGRICTILLNAPIAGITGVAPGLEDTAFDLVVTGADRKLDPFHPPVRNNDNGGGIGNGCPDPMIAVPSALCITAVGHVRGGSIRRRIDNDTDPVACRQ